MRHLLIIVSLVACQPIPPAPPAPRTAMSVAAPFNRAWDSAIETFADRTIQIKTLDRSSGLIIAEAQPVALSDPVFADCGTDGMGGVRYPTAATWNLLIRGDSTSSTIKATVRFVHLSSTRSFMTGQPTQNTAECSTLGVWETEFEARIKSVAEAKRP